VYRQISLQPNAIEAAPGSSRGSAQEWYLSTQDKEKIGPLGFDEVRNRHSVPWISLKFKFDVQVKELHKSGKIVDKTKCWAQGMDQWRSMPSVAQFRWTLYCTGQSALPANDFAIVILNTLIKICQFYPSR